MKIVFLIILILFGQKVFAHNVDSTKTEKPVISAYKYNSNFTKRYKADLDTAIEKFHEYEPQSNSSNYTVDLGYYGAPSFSLLAPTNISQEFFVESISEQLFTVENATYYNTLRPFTTIMFSAGANSEQNLSLLHTQNVTKDLNVGTRMRFYKSLGEYEPQGAGSRHISPWVTYTGDKYSIHFIYDYNYHANDENGGLVHDSLIDYPSSYLMNVSSANSRKEYHDAFLIQKWNLSGKNKVFDSTRIEMPRYKHSIGHSLYYNKAKLFFEDDNISGDFYPYLYYDSLETYDTTISRNIINKLFFESTIGKEKNSGLLHVGAGLDYLYQSYMDYEYDFLKKDSYTPFVDLHFQYTVFNHLEIETNNRYDLIFNKPPGFSSENSFKYLLYNKGSKNIVTSLYYNVSQDNPKGLLTNYNSNHIKWSNEAKNVFKQKVGLTLKSDFGNIEFQASFSQINNALYFDSDWTMNQAADPSFIAQVQLRKLTKIWNFYLDNSIIYQKVKSNAFSLPELLSYNSVYYKGRFFRKLVTFKIGLDGLWHTKYNAPSYIPTIGAFANQDEILIGNYPSINVFLSLKYKPIRIMLKYKGLYSDIFNKNFVTVNYPQQSGYIAFALSWSFYN